MFKFTVEKFEPLNVDFKGCLYVGVPKSKSTYTQRGKAKPRTEFTNAQILMYLEHGSPIRNMEPRPVIEPTLKLHRRELTDAINGAIRLVVAGTEDEVDKYFETLALRIQSWVQLFFVREGQAIWSPSQRVLRERRKGRVAKTLIDTGSLRGSMVCYYSKSGIE